MFGAIVVIVSILACAYGAALHRGLTHMFEGRIVGGEETTIDKFPWQISMQYFGSHRCGGSIINEKTIVSAAHCVEGAEVNNLLILAGTKYLNYGGVRSRVQRYVRHPKYNPYTVDNDLSVLFLATKLRFGLAIAPIALPNFQEEIRSGELAIVSGWGTLREGSNLPSILQAVNVTLVSQANCSEAYSIFGGITDSMICAGEPQGGKDACQGDSGGPLVANKKLVGVVSWGYGCARPNYPGVYARVASMRDWLDQVILPE